MSFLNTQWNQWVKKRIESQAQAEGSTKHIELVKKEKKTDPNDSEKP